jgi:hypothetical protein
MKIKVLTILTLLLLSFNLYSQCPWNKVNCAFGCGRHFDENGDGFCDYSIIDKSLLQNKDNNEKVKKTEENSHEHKNAVDTPANQSIKKKTTQSNNKILPENKIDSNSIEVIIEDVISNNDTITELAETLLNQTPPQKKEKPYDLIFISILTLASYSFSFFLSKFNIIKKVYHRRFWNLILLLTFVVSCLFGFFLVIQINYNFVMEWFRTILYWHVQIGISMTIISIFHIFWHIKYFKNILKRNH